MVCGVLVQDQFSYRFVNFSAYVFLDNFFEKLKI